MSTEQPWTIKRLLEWTEQFLASKGVEFPRLDSQLLLGHVLGCQKIQLYSQHYFEEATDDVRQRYRDLIRRRVEGCPVAYLVGRKDFYSLEFEVGPAVLIPRPDTESLVDECLRLAKAVPEPLMLDIGTGSGAIAVAVAHYHKGAKVTATDVSSDALAVASRNAAKHGVGGRVRFLQGDLFAPVPAGESFDFVLSNPPYIPHDEIPRLQAGVRAYEPHLALDGGPDGFAIFDHLADQARHHLKPGGHLIVEIGSPQEERARQRIASFPEYELGKTIHDGSGHPRVLRARRRGD